MNSINLIDLGDDIEWESNTILKDCKFNNIDTNFLFFQKLLKTQLNQIKRINIFFTHYHLDHRNGIDNFLKFLCQNDLYLNRIPIIIYLCQPSNINLNIEKKKYYSNYFFRNLIDEIQKSIDSLKGDMIYFSVRALHAKEFIEMRYAQLRFLRRLLSNSNFNYFQLIPSNYLNDGIKGIVYVFSTIMSYAIDPIKLKSCNIEALKNFDTISESLNDDHIDFEIFNDKSHSFDHMIFKITFKEEKKVIIHLGDLFPFCYALNDIYFSDHKNFFIALRKIINWIDRCFNEDLEPIIICSHTHNFPNSSGNLEFIPNSFVNGNDDFLLERIKQYCQDIEYYISEKNKLLGFQKDYLLTHIDDIGEFKTTLINIINNSKVS